MDRKVWTTPHKHTYCSFLECSCPIRRPENLSVSGSRYSKAKIARFVQSSLVVELVSFILDVYEALPYNVDIQSTIHMPYAYGFTTRQLTKVR